MADDLNVTEHEHDVTRVFAVSASDTDARKFANEDTRTEAVADALGVNSVDPKYVDVVKVKDLGDLGLSGYLSDGHGIDDGFLAPDVQRLDALGGTVLVIGSGAFPDRPAVIRPKPELSHIATYRVDARDAPLEELPHGHTSSPDVERKAQDMPDRDQTDPVDRSTVRWIVIGGLVVAVILVAMVAF